MKKTKNNHFDFALTVYGLTLFISPCINFLLSFFTEYFRDFNSAGMLLLSLIVFVLFFILTLPTFYAILFFTKIFFTHNKSQLNLRFILFGLCATVFTFNIFILTYPIFGFDPMIIHFFTIHYFVMFFLIFFLKIESPKTLIRKSPDAKILDDDLD